MRTLIKLVMLLILPCLSVAEEIKVGDKIMLPFGDIQNRGGIYTVLSVDNLGKITVNHRGEKYVLNPDQYTPVAEGSVEGKKKGDKIKIERVNGVRDGEWTIQEIGKNGSVAIAGPRLNLFNEKVPSFHVLQPYQLLSYEKRKELGLLDPEVIKNPTIWQMLRHDCKTFLSALKAQK